jgi:cholesterol oxidase
MNEPMREIPIFTLEGVRDAEITTHYITTEDKLGLSMLRFRRGTAPARDVVLLLHGLTTSTDMFIMPEHVNLVSVLLDRGYEVWSFDWRGSLRHSYDLFPGRFNLDEIALYDHPAAVAHLRREVGEGPRLHVICHCVGSITFMMSLFAGLIDGVSSVVSNSVSLTPRVPRWSEVKLTLAPFFMNWILRFPNLNPRWGYLPGPGIPQGKPLSKIIDLLHPECDVPACHMISFMWGAGRPAAYEHDNLTPITHQRLGDLFGAININYYLHIREMARLHRAVKMHPDDPQYARLPNDYLERAAQVTAPILFITGDHNKVFMDSNVTTYETLRKLQPEDRNALRILPGYGHQDPFMGRNVHVDVFPHLVEWIEKHQTAGTQGRAA